jgi:excisionase family DNA binding protein
MADRLWRNDETAEYLGCTPGTLRAWVSRRRVPFVRIRRLVRFRKSDLDQWMTIVEPKQK